MAFIAPFMLTGRHMPDARNRIANYVQGALLGALLGARISREIPFSFGPTVLLATLSGALCGLLFGDDFLQPLLDTWWRLFP